MDRNLKIQIQGKILLEINNMLIRIIGSFHQEIFPEDWAAISERDLVALNRIKSTNDGEVVTPRSPVVAHGREMVFLKNRS
jgi:hypothetical protein